MLINLSNHPSSNWDSFQHESAAPFGEIIDIPFPEIDPDWDSQQIKELAREYLQRIKTLAGEESAVPVVHIMGEYSFCYQLVEMLKNHGIDAVVSTSKRQSVINSDGTKTIRFDFVKFRNY